MIDKKKIAELADEIQRLARDINIDPDDYESGRSLRLIVEAAEDISREAT